MDDVVPPLSASSSSSLRNNNESSNDECNGLFFLDDIEPSLSLLSSSLSSSSKL